MRSKDKKKLKKAEEAEVVPEEELEEELEEEPEEEYDEDDEQEDKPRSGLKAALVIVGLIAAAALIGIAGWFIKNAIDQRSGVADTVTGDTKPPEITRDETDPEIYYVTVYAKAGKTVVFEDPQGRRTEKLVPGEGKVTFKLMADKLIPNEAIEGAFYTVTPKIYIRGGDGSLTPVPDLEDITIEVPQINVTLETPEEVFSYDGEVRIKGRVIPSASEVFVNGEQIKVGFDGSFNHVAVYAENGVHELLIEAKTPCYSIYRKVISVTVDIPEPPVVLLPWDMGDSRFSQRVVDPGDTVTIYGKAPEGAVVSADCASPEVTLETPEFNVDGTFSIKAVMSEIGDYVIVITCTEEDGTVSTREAHIQRAPAAKGFIESAWAMDVSAFRKPSKRAYRIQGKVVELIKHGDYYLAVLETSDGTRLILEYHNHYPTANTLEVGKEYNWIYGQPLGLNEDGIPQIYVWFVNDK